MKLSDERLKEIRERCEKATLGPWRAADEIGSAWPVAACGNSQEDGADWNVIVDAHVADAKTDAHFIAHARTDIPDLLGALEEARAELRELRERERSFQSFYRT